MNHIIVYFIILISVGVLSGSEMGGAGGWGAGGRGVYLPGSDIYRRGGGVGRGVCVSDHIIPVGMLSGSDKEGEVEVWLRGLGDYVIPVCVLSGSDK